MVLPQGWKEKESKSAPGRKYYVNQYTGASQWQVPASPAEPEQPGIKIRCMHILLKHIESRRLSSWREKAITRTKAEAMTQLGELAATINTPEDFADVAFKVSECKSAQRRGDLGEFVRGKMQKPFEDAAFSLRVGEMSGVVSTQSGLHIILRTPLEQ